MDSCALNVWFNGDVNTIQEKSSDTDEGSIQDLFNKKGYSEKTPHGNPSTIYQYLKSINNICKWENTIWTGLRENILNIVSLYDEGGAKEVFGKKSHKTVINALKRFSEFLSP